MVWNVSFPVSRVARSHLRMFITRSYIFFLLRHNGNRIFSYANVCYSQQRAGKSDPKWEKASQRVIKREKSKGRARTQNSNKKRENPHEIFYSNKFTNSSQNDAYDLFISTPYILLWKIVILICVAKKKRRALKKQQISLFVWNLTVVHSFVLAPCSMNFKWIRISLQWHRRFLCFGFNE